MRTVICHFYNESYLLPWWLKHHVPLFDYGIMINHGSTDDSIEIVKQYAPHWRIVNSTLTTFNAYMTDFEVMSYEKELPGWKIALNVTEFFMPSMDLNAVQALLEKEDRMGVSCSGYICVDSVKDRVLDPKQSLVSQLHWGFNDNLGNITPQKRQAMNLGLLEPARNRFFHRNVVGMYHPGRHKSFHPDAQRRIFDIAIFHYMFAPWNTAMIQRKLGIRTRLDPQDVKHGWGHQHQKQLHDLEAAYQVALTESGDLMQDLYAKRAIEWVGNIQNNL